MRPIAECGEVWRLKKKRSRVRTDRDDSGRRETLANTGDWVRPFGLSATEAGRQTGSTGRNKMAAVCSRLL